MFHGWIVISLFHIKAAKTYQKVVWLGWNPAISHRSCYKNAVIKQSKTFMALWVYSYFANKFGIGNTKKLYGWMTILLFR